ncbi:MAG: polysaccharide biosynthesis protein [Syntrophaceae bacterium]|nr:polysaccharide biosynthesis protein [Syntrophaceae bacterium]
MIEFARKSIHSMQPQRILFRRINQLFIDALIFALSFFLAYFIRFEGMPSENYLRQMVTLFPYVVLARMIIFHLFPVYQIVWRYISIDDAMTILRACVPVSLLLLVGRLVLPGQIALLRVPLGVLVLEFLLVLVGTLGIRMLRRFYSELQAREIKDNNNKDAVRRKKALLIGAGDAGNLVVKELKQRTDLGQDVVGFIDDDPRKFNSIIQGKKVLGGTSQLPEIVRKHNIDEAIITIANASSKDIRRIVEACEQARLKVRIVPGLFEMLDDRVKITKIRDINIDDLLGRSLVRFENHLSEVEEHYRNKRIMVTGAGGSIGGELCRQLCTLWPKELILLDKDENSVYEIDSELRWESGSNSVSPVVADLRNTARLEYIFNKYRPQVIFHAAAHKHVPLMELNVAEAVSNNLMGTRNVAVLADKNGVENFISISTDKAINPTSIMGASKKLGEIIIQEIARESRARYSCVRFGNVLGSRGSVVPLFQKQIAAGGPVTVTHPDVRRYFMSISEAVQLIIQAGTMGNRGEIFVLDMGEPIKIQDLARDLIRLYGYDDNEIEIKYIGLRPGEKLYEEILVDEERDKATKIEKIFVAPPIEMDKEDFSTKLEDLLVAAERNDNHQVIACLQDLGIGYKSENKDFLEMSPRVDVIPEKLKAT